jgi:hypothetical protein
MLFFGMAWPCSMAIRFRLSMEWPGRKAAGFARSRRLAEAKNAYSCRSQTWLRPISEKPM